MFIGGCPIMPIHSVFHKRNSLTLNSVGNNDTRLPGREWGRREGCCYSICIVSVYLSRTPTECFPFLCEWFKGKDIVRAPIRLNLVIIYDRDKIIQSMMTCKEDCFPCRSLIALTIGEHDHSAIRYV